MRVWSNPDRQITSQHSEHESLTDGIGGIYDLLRGSFLLLLAGQREHFSAKKDYLYRLSKGSAHAHKKQQGKLPKFGYHGFKGDRRKFRGFGQTIDPYHRLSAMHTLTR